MTPVGEQIREAFVRRTALSPHGRLAKFYAGCRCLKCRLARSQYEKARYQLWGKQGLRNPLVDAARARAHLVVLAANGVGYRTAAARAGVADRSIKNIRNGSKTRLRMLTEQKILSVSAPCAANQ